MDASVHSNVSHAMRRRQRGDDFHNCAVTPHSGAGTTLREIEHKRQSRAGPAHTLTTKNPSPDITLTLTLSLTPNLAAGRETSGHLAPGADPAVERAEALRPHEPVQAPLQRHRNGIVVRTLATAPRCCRRPAAALNANLRTISCGATTKVDRFPEKVYRIRLTRRDWIGSTK